MLRDRRHSRYKNIFLKQQHTYSKKQAPSLQLASSSSLPKVYATEEIQCVQWRFTIPFPSVLFWVFIVNTVYSAFVLSLPLPLKYHTRQSLQTVHSSSVFYWIQPTVAGPDHTNAACFVCCGSHKCCCVLFVFNYLWPHRERICSVICEQRFVWILIVKKTIECNCFICFLYCFLY